MYPRKISPLYTGVLLLVLLDIKINEDGVIMPSCKIKQNKEKQTWGVRNQALVRIVIFGIDLCCNLY